ncbi:hypothetical protein GWK48_10115 [Metallosphaera tengchongensis]|uniref:Calcineurin-like phosphoesterase domain-containing protein n=1 Tax=Metallosphaera tengchongensis TaxID=1532350 RepID=A0A6N0NWX4_9CREN|nr:metallophosphoesterase [Metallosphaera tengchongensis]QKR00695.1 hypothetical protein GWK48_10115 [Metallosphaera tengchongensis]
MGLFRRRNNNESVGGRKTKILFTSDIHGSETAFRKFLNAGQMYGVDALIIGGDIAGKNLVPIVHRGETYLLNGKEIHNLNRAIEEFRKSGTYYSVMSQKEYEEVASDKRKQRALFDELMKDSLRRWSEIAEEKLGKKIPLYVNLGNDDPEFLFQVMGETETMRRCEGNIIELGGSEMISLGYVNPTPWKTPRELTEEQIESTLVKEVEKLGNVERAIFNLHAPPYGTSLDNAPMLNGELKPVVKGMDVVLTHVGSSAVRRVIHRYQPMLGLHGHIHESRGFDKVGRTVIINPGSEFSRGILHAALILLEESKVSGYQLITG